MPMCPIRAAKKIALSPLLFREAVSVHGTKCQYARRESVDRGTMFKEKLGCHRLAS